MKVLEQKMHKGFEISNFWQERIFNIDTNKLDYSIVGVYRDYPKAIVILGSYGTETERTKVYEMLCEQSRRDKEFQEIETFIMPDREN